jgi:hypothetical protein
MAFLLAGTPAEDDLNSYEGWISCMLTANSLHITSHLNQAVDQVRRAESTRLRTKSKQAAKQLKHTRWPLLRNLSRVRGRARQKLQALLAAKLATARAWELKEAFRHFWKYRSVLWAGAFLAFVNPLYPRCRNALRDPFIKFRLTLGLEADLPAARKRLNLLQAHSVLDTRERSGSSSIGKGCAT